MRNELLSKIICIKSYALDKINGVPKFIFLILKFSNFKTAITVESTKIFNYLGV
jgi:hypothetical protein